MARNKADPSKRSMIQKRSKENPNHRQEYLDTSGLPVFPEG